MSKPLILELKEKAGQLLKKITINEDVTDLVVEVKLDKTSEIIFNGVVTDNVYVIPNSDKLNFCRTAITQNYEKRRNSRRSSN